MKKQILLATSNQNKVREMKDDLLIFFDDVLSLKDVNLTIDVEETGTTFLENSKIKASDVSLKTNIPVLGDDSGLEIDVLDGRPGIYSARFLQNESYETKCKELLKLLKDKDSREASFPCALTYIDKVNRIEKQFVGKCNGKIVDTYQECKYGFGYDPIFYSYEANDIFGNIPKEEKFKYSHRGKAVKMLLDFLKEVYHEGNIRNR